MNSVLELPFVSDGVSGELSGARCFWDVLPSGDYGADCETGKEYAQVALGFADKNNLAPLITWIIKDMDVKNMGGVEVGFISTLTEEALRCGSLHKFFGGES